MSDPLSFFAVDSDDSSDSEDEAKSEEKPVQTNEPISTQKSPSKALPPPMDALAGAKRPEFTINPLRQGVNWNKLTKKAPELPEKEYKPWEHRLPSVDSSVKSKTGETQLALAQQVPGAMVQTPAPKNHSDEIVDRAIQWSKMYQNLDKNGKVKRVRPEEIGGEEGFLYTDLEAEKVAYGGAKRQKTESKSTEFRVKEAKKRTMGMSNRDKMFVEDEKRILRQEYDTNY